MRQVIDWLMQTTADGSTYLQVIILTILLAVVTRVFVIDIRESIKDIKIIKNDKKKDL